MSKYKTYKEIKQGFSSERKEKIEQGANKIREELKILSTVRLMKPTTIYLPEEKQSLAEATKEIQQLLEQLDQTYDTDTVSGQMQAAQEAMTQIKSDMSLGDRILSALRVGGSEALKQTLNHPAATFVLALLDDWQKTKVISEK